MWLALALFLVATACALLTWRTTGDWLVLLLFLPLWLVAAALWLWQGSRRPVDDG